MKKMIMILALVAFMFGSAYAEDNVAVKGPGLLPSLQVDQAVAYSFRDSEVKSYTSVDLVSYDTGYGRLSAGAGYITDKTGAADISYDIGSIDDIPGVDFPYAEIFNLSVGFYGGYTPELDGDEQWDYGVLANVISGTF